MKPNKVFLIILSVFITFGVLLGGIYFYVSKVLTPENVRDLITQNLKETFPKAKVEVGEVDFKFGTSIDFIIKKINIETTEPMASVSDAKLRIPVWSILKGGGVVEVEINGPQFFWSKVKKSESNWAQAMNASNPSKSTTSVPVILPAFLATSRLNIKMKDSKFKYYLSDSEKGAFLISKFLIKELGLENPAAFEIDTAIVMQKDSLGELTANMLIIGEADLHRFISEGKLTLISVATVSKIKSLRNGLFPLSEIRMDLKSDIYKSGNINGDAKVSFYDSSLSFKILKKSEELKVDNLKAALSIKDFISFVPKLANKVNPGKSLLSIEGSIDLGNQQIRPSLQISMNQGLSYNQFGQSYQPTLIASINDKKVEMKVDLPLYQGQSTTTIKFSLPKELNFENYVPDLLIETSASGLNLTSKDLIQINESSKASVSSDDKVVKELVNESSGVNSKDPVQGPFVVPLNWQLEVSESMINNKNLSLKANTQITSIGAAKFISQTNIASGTMSTDANFLNKDNTGKLLVSFRKFPGDLITPFIAERGVSFEGEINGIIKSNFKKRDESFSYDSKYDLKVTKGKISKVNPSDWLASLTDAIKPFYPAIGDVVKNISIQPDFSILEVEGTATNEKLSFKELFFKGVENKFEISAKGSVYLNDTDQSELIADYKDNKGNLSAFLLKEVGTEILPLKLIGVGTNLKPDVTYTSKKLTSILLKKKGTSKVKDLAKKLLKNGDPEKLDKLLKGILK